MQTVDDGTGYAVSRSSSSTQSNNGEVVVLDIRGNHDAYGALNDNYAKQYSISGHSDLLHDDRRAHVHLHELDDGTVVKFLLMDAASTVNYNFPLNFFGELSESVISQVERGLRSQHSAGHTFILGHYPICTQDPVDHWPMTARQVWRKRLLQRSDGSDTANVTAYMNGHVHMQNLYSRLFDDGMLELELADWKQNSYFRLAAVDHGMFSFVDLKMQKIGDRPILLVTNPKDSRFLTKTDQWQNMLQSSHVRILVVTGDSATTLSRAEIYIDDVMIGNLGVDETTSLSKRHGADSGQMLLSAAWDPKKYADGKQHTIRVVVVDEYGRSNQVSHPFSVEGIIKRDNFFPNIVQSLSFHTAAYVLVFVIYLYVMLWLLIVPRIGACIIKRRKMHHEVEQRILLFMNLRNGLNGLEQHHRHQLVHTEEGDDGDADTQNIEYARNVEMSALITEMGEGQDDVEENPLGKVDKSQRSKQAWKKALSFTINVSRDTIYWSVWKVSAVPTWQFWIQVIMGVWLLLGFVYYAPVQDGAHGYGFVTAFGVFMQGHYHRVKETVVFFWTPVMLFWASSILFSRAMTVKRKTVLMRAVHTSTEVIDNATLGGNHHNKLKSSVRIRIWIGRTCIMSLVSILVISAILLCVQIAFTQGPLTLLFSPGVWLMLLCVMLVLIPSSLFALRHHHK